MNVFFSQHLLAAKSALRRLLATPLSSLLSLLVIGVALALPSAGWLALDNLSNITGKFSGVQQISLFMQLDSGAKERAEIERRLTETNLKSWRFVAKDDALKQLQAAEEMREILTSLATNPLPDAFIIEPTDSHVEALTELSQTFSSWPAVAQVQLDSAWIKRLNAFIRISQLAVSLLAGLFSIALVVVTFNTIRLQILAQATEIEVATLIGATDAFIQRPYQYFGALQGAFGGLFAALLVSLGGMLLNAPIDELAQLYHSQFIAHGLSSNNIAALAAVGATLGWLGAQLSVSLHLRIKPKHQR